MLKKLTGTGDSALPQRYPTTMKRSERALVANQGSGMRSYLPNRHAKITQARHALGLRA